MEKSYRKRFASSPLPEILFWVTEYPFKTLYNKRHVRHFVFTSNTRRVNKNLYTERGDTSGALLFKLVMRQS